MPPSKHDMGASLKSLGALIEEWDTGKSSLSVCVRRHLCNRVNRHEKNFSGLFLEVACSCLSKQTYY